MKPGNRRLYPWEEWFARPRTVLLRRIHYHCSQAAMVQMIRNNASARGVRVRPIDNGISITIEVCGDHLYGWAVAHFRKARTSKGWITAVGADGKGWPDLFLCHPERGIAIARELKVPPNNITPEQQAWLRVLNATGVDARVWTPNDWAAIEHTLRGR